MSESQHRRVLNECRVPQNPRMPHPRAASFAAIGWDQNPSRTLILLLTLSLLLAAAACTKKNLATALPASGEAAGWEKTGGTKSYTAANLSDYIDGGADQYIKAGFASLATSEYKFQGHVEAVADIYQMASPAAAKSIFEADPAGKSKPAGVGDDSRLFSQSLIFRSGPYLVRLVAYQESPDTAPALGKLAAAINQKLPK
jgi:hypothetical protein